MKRKLILCLMLLFTAIQVSAQYKDLLVSYKSQPNPKTRYTFAGMYKNRPFWTNSLNHIAFYGTFWAQSMHGSVVVDTLKFGNFPPNDISNETKNTYPTDGWSNLVVEPDGAGLSYSHNFFLESSANDGSFQNTVLIRHNLFENEAFSGKAGDDFVADKLVSLENLPFAFTGKLIKLNDSTLAFTLVGKTANHGREKDPASITLSFEDAAFTNGGKAANTNKSTFKIVLRYRNVITVDKNSPTFKTIKMALDSAKNMDIIHINKGIYTESGLTNTMTPGLTEIIIEGDSPENTIIQADSLPYNAVNKRVFFMAGYDSFFLSNVTVRHGFFTVGGDGVGMLLYAKSKESINFFKNCRITKNANRSGFLQACVGGGIYTSGRIRMVNCEVSDNEIVNDDGSGTSNKFAAGMAASGGFDLVNCTVSGNKAAGAAGGVYCPSANNTVTVIKNSTITNNSAGILAAGIWTFSRVTLINSIVAGNKAPATPDIGVQNRLYTVTVINSFVKDTSRSENHTYPYYIGEPITKDPMLDTVLRFNCSELRTHALLPGSPAINAAFDTSSNSNTDQRGFPVIDKKDVGAYEFNAEVTISIAADTVCIEDKKIIELTAQPNVGVFSGEFVSNNQLDLSSLKDEGFVYVTYTYSLPGCENVTLKDSIYAKVCKVNSTQNIELPVRMYPNPVQSELHFDLNASDLMDIQIMDISGKLVHGVSQVSPKTAVNVADLPNGLYFVKVVSGGRSAHMKFIKN